jgi:hypothetical protein
MRVSEKPYKENEYVKLGTYNFKIGKTIHILVQF